LESLEINQFERRIGGAFVIYLMFNPGDGFLLPVGCLTDKKGMGDRREWVRPAILIMAGNKNIQSMEDSRLPGSAHEWD